MPKSKWGMRSIGAFKFLVLYLCCFSPLVAADLALNAVPPEIVLKGDAGGRVAGGGWKSSELMDRVHVLFYVDPDQNELNEHVTKALKKEHFPEDKFGSVAIINMAATWKPNFAIDTVLASRQREFPKTIYVRDLRKVLVKTWGLLDDSSDIVVFDKEGKVVFRRDDKLSDADVVALIDVIKKNL